MNPQPTPQKMNEYQSVQKQMNEIIQKRLKGTYANNSWNYQKQVGQALHQQPMKYANVHDLPKVQFTQDIRRLIYNQTQFPQDVRLWNLHQWQLINIAQVQITPPPLIPSQSYLKSSKTRKMDPKQSDLYFGTIQFSGKLKGRTNHQTQYNNYHFNLRNKCLVLYSNQTPQAGQKQSFYITLNQRSFDYHNDSSQHFLIKGDQKSLKIMRDSSSKQLIQKLQKKLLYFSFVGAYACRNQVPDWRIQDYINQISANIGPMNFHNQSTLKQVINIKQYKETVGGFCRLLQKYSKQRLHKPRSEKKNQVLQTKAGEIYYPRWLKQTFKQLPIMQTWLATNVLPPQSPLMSLKIKVAENQKKILLHSIKYIFPYMDQYVKRSISIYQSTLQDQDSRTILQNISFPMYLISFPHNNLSQKALQHAIQKSSDLQNQIIDFSHNKNLFVLKGVHVINMINNNPTIKKLFIKGCQIQQQQCNQFFDALSSNICLEQIQFDYQDYYHQNMNQFLCQFDAIIQ